MRDVVMGELSILGILLGGVGLHSSVCLLLTLSASTDVLEDICLPPFFRLILSLQ